MIKSIIVDDEQPCIDALKSDIIKYCSNIEICATCLSGKEGVLAIKKYHPRLIFLDVEMPWMNGFEMLEMLDHIDFCIVFTTAYDKFAARAFRISAVDYLLKPIAFDRFFKAAQKAQGIIQPAIAPQVIEHQTQQIQPQQPQQDFMNDFIFVKSEYKIQKVYLHQILYIEGLKDYICLKSIDPAALAC